MVKFYFNLSTLNQELDQLISVFNGNILAQNMTLRLACLIAVTMATVHLLTLVWLISAPFSLPRREILLDIAPLSSLRQMLFMRE